VSLLPTGATGGVAKQESAVLQHRDSSWGSISIDDGGLITHGQRELNGKVLTDDPLTGNWPSHSAMPFLHFVFGQDRLLKRAVLLQRLDERIHILKISRDAIQDNVRLLEIQFHAAD
jgi:hypothetical protein